MITLTALDAPLPPHVSEPRLSLWVEAVAREYGRRVGDITYIFVSEERMLEVNRQYLGHDYYTDIITFDYTEASLLLSGDLFVCPDTVRSNAAALGLPFEEELRRVLIHGILHLCGIPDKAPGEREKMEKAENKALALLASL